MVYEFITENPCLLNDCQSPFLDVNTTCKVDGPGLFSCVCPSGFGGEKCEIRKNEKEIMKMNLFTYYYTLITI